MSTILIKNGIIATGGGNNKVLYGHSLLIEGTKIKRIAPEGEFKDSYDKIIDAHGKLIMPGFINAHMHFYSTMVRGYGGAEPSKDFVEVLKHLWWKLDKKLTIDDCYYSTIIPLLNGIRYGTTTYIDHHASPGAATGSLDVIAKAVKEAGVRASLCYELSDRDGEKIAREGIEENINFIKRCKKENDDQLRALFGLHASFTVTDKTMEEAASAGKELGTGFHVHTAEAASDQEYNVKNFGMRVVERFNKYGILGPKTICAHCVHINDKEMDLLAETGTNVVHNPQSNMNNAVGIADIIKMTEKGITVGLGTDAMTVNMMEEVRVALWAQHLKHDNPSVGFCEAFNALLVNNVKIASKYWDLGLGTLTEGGAADVILIDYYAPTPLSDGTFLGHFGYGVSQSFVDTTICNGKVLMENKILKLNIDEEEIARKSKELTKKLWERMEVSKV
ncbi:MAG: putative aminohydrolase SsnA [Armatimonadota bacterium]